MTKARPLFVVCLLLFSACSLASRTAAQGTGSSGISLPLVFEKNGGQVPAKYDFVARSAGSELMFFRDGVDIFVAGPDGKVESTTLRFGDSGHSAAPVGGDQLMGHSNYLHGSDPTRWVTGVPQFSRLRFKDINKGVDLEFHGAGQDLENDFLVAAGANPDAIVFRVSSPVRLNRDGELEILAGSSVIHLRKPVAYQFVGGVRREVAVGYSIGDRDEVRFKLGALDRSQPLVIDPVFTFSTYLAGSNMDQINAVTTDAAGNVYVTGNTMSVDFPVAHAEQPTCNSCGGPGASTDAYVSKLDPTGHTLLISTYLGGSNSDTGDFIAVDSQSNIVVGGVSLSNDFPHAGSVAALTCQTNDQCYFVSSIKPDGSAFNYSGLVGGIAGFADNSAGAMLVDASGDVYLAGTTDDPNFQITPGTLAPSFIGYPSNETFVLKLDSTGKLLYSTPVPGNATPPLGSVHANSFAVFAMAIDGKGDATITGVGGIGLPTTSGVLLPEIPPQQNQSDPTQGFVLQINAEASAVNFATYVPGADNVYGMTVDGNGNFLLTGETAQTTLAVSSNAYQKTIPASSLGPGDGGFVLKMNGQGTATLGGTYLASPTASGGVYLHGIALDSNGNVFVGGNTGATDFPLVNPFTTIFVYAESGCMVLAELSADFSKLEFGSYLSSTNQAGFAGTAYAAIAVDAQGNLVATGNTDAIDFPTTANSFQPAPPTPSNPLQVYGHGVISKLDIATAAPSVCFASQYVNFGTVDVNAPTQQTLTLTNCGNAALTISSVKSSATNVTAGAACASVTAGATCGIPLTFTATDTSTTSGTITLTDNAAITTQTVQFTGAGGTPQVTLPVSIVASDALVGTSVTYSIPFINLGNAPWVVSSVTVTGDFTVKNECTSPVPGTGTLQNNTCQIFYTFTPTQAGTLSGTLTIADNQAGSPHAIPISGQGLTSYTVPTITSIDAVPNDEQLPFFFVVGTNFFPASQAIVNGVTRTTTYVDENDITVQLTPADLAQPNELTVTVSNPFPGGGLSNSFPGDIYGVMRKITVSDSTFDSKTGHIFATVAAGSTNNAGQLIEIDPQTVSIVNAWNVGNGPNHIAISDDDSFLYVGLDTDHTVAQVALPGGTVNFAVALTAVDGSGTNAEALRVLPGKPHSWVVTPCSAYYSPCGTGVTVYDDSTARPTTAAQLQALPDQLLFIGTNATALYGTTDNQQLPNLYAFTIGASGITLTNTAPTNGGNPGGGMLDTDGKLIYSSNGQIIDPATLTISNTVSGIITGAGIKVDTSDAQIYYIGQTALNSRFPIGLTAFGLTSLKPNGALTFPEDAGLDPKVFRYSTNGIATLSGNYNFFFQTSLTGTPITPTQLAVSGWAPTTVAATAGDVALSIAGSNFASGDTVTANGTAITATVQSATQMNATIPAAIIATGGTVQVVITSPSKQTATLVVVVNGTAPPVAGVSPESLTFTSQLVGTQSAAQTVTVGNTGSGTLTVSSVTISGDFMQTNNCTSVASGASCTVSVIFAPTATGSRTGVLTISDNDASKTQTVSLTGTGGGLQIGPASGGSTSATVNSGQPATYNLSIAPQGGFTGNVTFSCSGLPTAASCSISPTSATFGTATVAVTVTVATEQQTAALLRTPPAGVRPLDPASSNPTIHAAIAMFVAGMISLGLFAVGRRRGSISTRAIQALAILMLCAAGMVGLASCGGGSSGGGGSSTKTPAGTYTITFVAAAGGGSSSEQLTLVVQ